MKTCRGCHLPKPEEAFWWKVPGVRRDTLCSDCDKARRKAWYEAHREQAIATEQARYWANREDILARQRQSQQRRYADWKASCSENDKRARLLKRYGLTVEDYVAMYKRQGGLCAACHEVPIGVGRAATLGVDHNHRTGARRELLCVRCNAALGMVDDSRAKLALLDAYLAKHEAVPAVAESNLIQFPAAKEA